jgi:hypothetical protein
MDREKLEKALSILTERFGHDTLLSLATLYEGHPDVRIVDGYYEDGSFYAVTYALSNKMKQIERIRWSQSAANGSRHMASEKT